MGMIFLGNVLEYSPFIVTLFHVCDPSERILDLASLYIGGCSLERHYKNIIADAPEYDLQFNGVSTKVKVSIRFRGREMAHTDIGAVLLKDFAEKCTEIANLDKAPKLEGRNMSMFLSPKPTTPPKKPAKPKTPKTVEEPKAEE